MKIQLIVIGKTNQNFVQQGLDEFCNRLTHYYPFELEIVPDIKNTKNLPVERQKAKEGELILQSFQTGDCIALLDERGKEFTRQNLPNTLKRKRLAV